MLLSLSLFALYCGSCSDRSSDAAVKAEKTFRAFERSKELSSSDPTATYFGLCAGDCPAGWVFFSLRSLGDDFLSLSSSPRPSLHGHAGLRRACAGEQRTCWDVADEPRSTREDPDGHSSYAQSLRSIRGESKLALTGRINTAEKRLRLRYKAETVDLD